MRSFFKRLVLYNILQTSAVSALVWNQYYWYENLNTWNDTMASIILCEMNKGSTDDYEMCVKNNEDPKPHLWTFYVFQLCAPVSVLGAIVFQCSLKMQKRTLSTMKRQQSPSHTWLTARLGLTRKNETRFMSTYLLNQK